MHSHDNCYLDRFIETIGRDALSEIQTKKFQMMLDSILESNAFYKNKFTEAGITSSAENACVGVSFLLILLKNPADLKRRLFLRR